MSAAGPSGARSLQPFIVEIAGPAASGKSALTQALIRANPRIIPGHRLRLDRFSQALRFAPGGLALLPIWLDLARKGQRLTRDQMKWMLYLQSWHRVLQRQSTDHQAIVAVDQGPLFYLSNLRSFGPSELQHSGWWRRVVLRWASTLNLIVLLDAPDDVLMDRIDHRAKPHLVKGASTTEMSRFLHAYRSSYGEVVNRMTACRDVRVLKFDTSRHAVESMVSEVQACLPSNGSSGRTSSLDQPGLEG